MFTVYQQYLSCPHPVSPTWAKDSLANQVHIPDKCGRQDEDKTTTVYIMAENILLMTVVTSYEIS